MKQLLPFLILSLSNCASAEPTTIIHLLNRHYVSPDDFAADLRNGTDQPTDQIIDKKYLIFLENLERIQKQQMQLMRRLIKKHDLKAVYVEGLTEKNHKETLKFIETLREYQQNKTAPESDFDRLLEAQNKIDLLELGAAGRLVISGELETILPAEESKSFEEANPVQPDGKIVFDAKADEKRENAIVMNLMKAKGVVVITLGGDHDLTDNIQRSGDSSTYLRVSVPKYKDVIEREN